MSTYSNLQGVGYTMAAMTDEAAQDKWQDTCNCRYALWRACASTNRGRCVRPVWRCTKILCWTRCPPMMQTVLETFFAMKLLEWPTTVGSLFKVLATMLAHWPCWCSGANFTKATIVTIVTIVTMESSHRYKYNDGNHCNFPYNRYKVTMGIYCTYCRLESELGGSVGMSFAYGSEGPRINSRLSQHWAMMNLTVQLM